MTKTVTKKAIVGETEQVYLISKKILDFLGTNLYDGDVLFGVGFKHHNCDKFDEIYLDGVKYTWISGGIMPSTYKIREENLYGVDAFSRYEMEVLDKLINGSEICSVSEYKRDEESYQRRLREKKLERVLK